MKKTDDLQSSFRGNKLYSFLKVAEIGSISKAAEQLNYTQSGLTYLLNTLETELGLQLLRRDHKGVYLTEEGRQLEPYFRSIIESEQAMKQKIEELTQNESEVIRIGAVPSIAKYCLPPLIKSFKDSYPSATVVFRSGGGADIPKLVKDHSLDIGIVDIVHAKDVDCIPLFDDQVLAAFPSDWNLTPQNGGIPLEALIDKPMLYFASNPLNSAVRIMDGKKIENKILIDSDGDTAISLISQGLGYSFLSQRYIADCPENVSMYPIYPPFKRRICLIADPLTALRPLAKKFVLLLQEQLC